MYDFLEAVAQSLRNFGFDDAVSIFGYVEVQKVRFHAQPLRKQFQFCGRTYKIGNVQQAVIDLIRQLPDLIEMRKKAIRLQELNALLKPYNLRIAKIANGYTLTYAADLDKLESIAKQIIDATEISFASIDVALGSLTATFTAEGGFSLN